MTEQDTEKPKAIEIDLKIRVTSWALADVGKILERAQAILPALEKAGAVKDVIVGLFGKKENK